ncbi:ABC transporter substrate-binding protein [Chelatococcus reniformis]|uniref:Branched-chain amino acid ABC transporter substrate-binding protein n=1 Tax=Chelatococcus reniformis TaxID=1494448 RepID=A0A916XML5_9HYPH|nr:ABC transporter substrate-binding protein [Chelatococcus reniformis]GGC87249.1 branched-chain amino acid ABC transporter substrate-binding protein [Chelatococcus reniformis]
MRRLIFGLAAATVVVMPAWAQVKVGIIVSATGPAASVGITQQRTAGILPSTLGGLKADYVLLDDASDTSTAVKHAQKLITDDKVDVIIGPSLTPNSLALLDLVTDTGTPMISLAGSALIVSPVDAKRHWTFKTPQSDAQMARIVIDHMQRQGLKSVAFIGFSDAYGEGWIKEMTKLAQAAGIEVVASERYQRTDTSVIGPILKIMSKQPQAVFIAASGTPAALPQTTLAERGYKGVVYQTHGVANNDFLRVGGAALAGTFVPAGPVLVAEQLPDSHAAKAPALDFIRRYEALPGAGARSTFAAYLWDAQLILDKAIAAASAKATPGTPAFRAALRDAIESTRDVAGPNGVYTLSPTDHLGLDERSAVMTQIVDGGWKLVK